MRPFQIVEIKLYETDFFFEKIKKCNNLIEAGYYFNAFISAARSVTFAIQASISDINSFTEWYNEKQKDLRNNELAKFFIKARNCSQKQGATYIRSGIYRKDENGNSITRFFLQTSDNTEEWVQEQISYSYYMENNKLDERDVALLCEQYFILLIEIVHECFQKFGEKIDPARYYTLENLAKIGLTIEDIEESFGLPKGWTKGIPDVERIKLLTREAGDTEIDYIFIKYLKKDRFNNKIENNIED